MQCSTIPTDTADSTVTTDPTRRYRCRHVFTDGHRCGSPSLRTQDLCYYHHASRREAKLTPGLGVFTMPRIDDRAAIQIALYDILARITLRDIDLKTAGMLLYGLQIASSNLTQGEKSARAAQSANAEPIVEDVVSNIFLGDLAPVEEMPVPAATSSTQDAVSTQTTVILSEARSAESKDPDTSHVAPDANTVSRQPMTLAAVHPTAKEEHSPDPTSCRSDERQSHSRLLHAVRRKRA